MGFRKPRFYFLASPNWANEVDISRQFVTTVTESVIGKEQRSSLIASPRKSIEYLIDTIEAKQSSYIVRVMHKYQHELFGVPQWPEYAALAAEAAAGQTILECGSLSYKEFSVGIELVIIGDDWETYEVGTIVEIDGNEIRLKENLTSTWPAGSEVYPVLPMRIDKSLSGQFKTDYFSGWRVNFRESLEATTTTVSTTTVSTTTQSTTTVTSSTVSTTTSSTNSTTSSSSSTTTTTT